MPWEAYRFPPYLRGSPRNIRPYRVKNCWGIAKNEKNNPLVSGVESGVVLIDCESSVGQDGVCVTVSDGVAAVVVTGCFGERQAQLARAQLHALAQEWHALVLSLQGAVLTVEADPVKMDQLIFWRRGERESELRSTPVAVICRDADRPLWFAVHRQQMAAGRLITSWGPTEERSAHAWAAGWAFHRRYPAL